MTSADWDRRYAGSDLVWTANPNRFLVAEAGDLPPGRALDLACGEGRNAVWLAERGWRVVGVDFSAVALDKARRLAAARGVEAEWVQADVVAHEPDSRGFDLVIAFYLQLRADSRRSALRAAAEAVAPGGALLVVAHDRTNIEDGHGGPQDPSVLYTADDVAADLEGTGLAVERGERVERPVETPDGERTALDVLVRARRA